MLKQTPEESADKQEIPKVVTLIREFLAEVNLQPGRTENRFNLLKLEQQLVFRQGEQVVRVSKRISIVYLFRRLGSEVEGRGS